MTEHKDEAIPLVVKTAPERIWLQVDTGAIGPSDDPFPAEHDGVSWCDEEIGGEEVEYMRADLAARDAKVEVTDAMCDRLYRALPLFCANITKDDARAALEAALAKENGNG